MTTYDDKLLHAVAQFPVIYNHTRSDYKNADVKVKAWEDVQRMMNTTESIDKIRQRWKSIRDSYVKYLNKKDRSISTGSKIRAYKFEKQLKFLKPFLTTQRDGTQHFEVDEFKIESPVTPDQVMSVTAYMDDDQYSNVSESSGIVALSRKRKQNDISLNEAISNGVSMLNHNHNAYRPIQQTEDLDSFFHALAQTVKKLKPLTAAMLKKEFFNKVADAEIRELRELQESSDFVAHENGF